MKGIFWLGLSSAIFLLAACGGGGSNGENPPPAPVNKAPTANAGADLAVDEQSTVALIGSGSDTDGSLASYQWTQIGGELVTLESENTSSASFLAPELLESSVLSFRLTVTDNKGATGTDDVTITVNPVNALPTVDASENRTVDEETSVTLVASASDTDGTIVSYAWQQTSGTPVTLTNADTSSLSFDAPTVAENQELLFSLTVTDNEGGVATDTVSITVNAICETDVGQVFRECLPSLWQATVWDDTEQTTYFGASGTQTNASWGVIDSGDEVRGKVFDFQTSHTTGVVSQGFMAITGEGLGWEDATAHNLYLYESGDLVFDIRVLNYGPDQVGITVAIGCGWPCGSQVYTVLTPQTYVANEWHTIRLPMSMFLNDNGVNSLDLAAVKSLGIGIPWTSDDAQAGGHFQLDNVRFELP